MFKRKSMTSTVLKVLLYGAVNFALILGLISITKFNVGSPIQGQLVAVLIIVAATGLVNYMMATNKF